MGSKIAETQNWVTPTHWQEEGEEEEDEEGMVRWRRRRKLARFLMHKTEISLKLK